MSDNFSTLIKKGLFLLTVFSIGFQWDCPASYHALNFILFNRHQLYFLEMLFFMQKGRAWSNYLDIIDLGILTNGYISLRCIHFRMLKASIGDLQNSFPFLVYKLKFYLMNTMSLLRSVLSFGDVLCLVSWSKHAYKFCLENS